MDSQNWKKVNTTENPAYVFSRGAYLSEYHGFRIVFPGRYMPTDPKNKNKWSRYGYRKWSHAGSKEVYKDTQKQGPASELVLSSMETEDVATICVYCSEVLTKTILQQWA